MVEGYIYLIWEEQFFKNKENVFKLGKSKDIFSRIMTGYPKGSKLLFTTYCPNIDEVETQLLTIFKQKYKIYNIGYYENSKERFNANNYYSIINDIISYLNLFNNNDNLVVTTQNKEEQKLINENIKKQKEEKKKQKEEDKKQKEEKKKQKEEDKKQKEEDKKQKEEDKKQKEEENKQKKETEKKKQILEKMLHEHIQFIKGINPRFKGKKIFSDRYIIDMFITDKLIKIYNPHGVTQTALCVGFNAWYQQNYGYRNVSKLELFEVVIKQFGNKNVKTNRWHNIQIKTEYEDDIDN